MKARLPLASSSALYLDGRQRDTASAMPGTELEKFQELFPLKSISVVPETNHPSVRFLHPAFPGCFQSCEYGEVGCLRR